MDDTGIEPVTPSMSRKCATAALIVRSRWRRDLNPCSGICSPEPRLSATPPDFIPIRFIKSNSRADDGGRTRDLNLGKVPRYQLRYVRIFNRSAMKEAKSIVRRREPQLHDGEGNLTEYGAVLDVGETGRKPLGDT